MRDIINLNVSFLGTDSTCESAHHGTGDCWFDAYSLCAKSIVAADFGWWDFTSCMYSKQETLCPETWDSSSQECGVESYNDTAFSTVVESCAASTSLTTDEKADLDACVVDADTGAMASEGAALVSTDMQYATQKNGGGKPTWIYVAGSLVDGDDYDDVDTWAEAVSTAICAAYDGDSEACS